MATSGLIHQKSGAEEHWASVCAALPPMRDILARIRSAQPAVYVTVSDNEYHDVEAFKRLRANTLNAAASRQPAPKCLPLATGYLRALFTN